MNRPVFTFFADMGEKVVKVLMLDWLITAVEVVLLTSIAVGVNWTAYESHVANIGVIAWQHQFDEIRQPDGPMDNHSAPEPSAKPTPKTGDVIMNDDECRAMLDTCKQDEQDLREDNIHLQDLVRGKHSL